MAKQAHKSRPTNDKGYEVVPFDDEERRIMADLKEDAYVSVPAPEFKRNMAKLKQAAAGANKKVPMTMRVERLTLDLIKLKAKREGMPYQTLISSILFKFARNEPAESRNVSKARRK